MSDYNMKASLCFHCPSCRDSVNDILEKVLQEIKDQPDLICKVDDSQVIIEGCFRTDEGEKRFINGKMVCVHWEHSSLFLTDSKKSGFNQTVLIQVKTPTNHFITLHFNFKENRVLFLDSNLCEGGLEVYQELASELKDIMKDLNISLIQVTEQKEIDDGFFHSVMNSLTVESSKNTNFTIFLREVDTFQRILKTNLIKRKHPVDQNIFKFNGLKNYVKKRIKSGIENDDTLGAIKESVKTECPNITRDSEVYIERQYAKRVAYKFLFLLKNRLKTQDFRYQMPWYKIEKISEINDIKEPFNTIQNYEQFQKCTEYFDSKAKLRFLKSFCDICRTYSTTVEEIEIGERNFLKELQNHMVKIAFGMPSSSEELSKCLQNSLKGSDKENNKKYLLQKFSDTKDESLLDIRRMVPQLLVNNSEFFVKSFESLIRQFNANVATNFVTENDINIFRCEGSFVDLETVNRQIEADHHSFNKCSQIEIQAELYFYVNCSVKWQGKNVIIATDTLIEDERQIHHTLDVSGRDGELLTKGRAPDGTEANMDGLAGETGIHGESGGNVQIIAKEFKTTDKISVISNGGNGSNGQDGGTGADGIDGKDGRGISEEEFNERFPDVAYIRMITSERNRNTFRYKNKFISISEESPAGSFSHGFPDEIEYYYLKGETDDHHLVEYAFWSTESFFPGLGMLVGAAGRESYCVCSGQFGTSGKPGGDGGKGGAGGKGGFEGKVDIRNWNGKKVYLIKTSGQSGQSGSDGKDGKGGKGGKNGKKGNDRAHVCPSQAQSTRLFEGHLNICSYDGSSLERAYCPKRKKYVNIIKRAYEYPTLQRCKDGEKGTNTKRVDNRLTESARKKKSPIVFQKIKEKYQHMFCAIDAGTSLQNNIDTNITMVEEVTSNYSFNLKRKVIKDTREHNYQNVTERRDLAPVHIARTSTQFYEIPIPPFKNNHDLEESIMNKVEEILAAANTNSEDNNPEKISSTIFADLDQILLENSFDEKHYEQLLQLIGLLKEDKNIIYWKDKIMINFKFYLLEKVHGITKMYIEGKKKEMDMNDPCSNTIMNDVQFGLKTLFDSLIFDVLKTDDVSYLKSMEQTVQKKIDDLIQTITISRRTVSIFAENVQMCSEKHEYYKDTMEKETDVHCSTLRHKDDLKDLSEQMKEIPATKMDIDFQKDSEFGKKAACKFELENIIEIENKFKMDTDVNKETETRFELENKNKNKNKEQIDSDVKIEKEAKHELDVTNVSNNEEGFVPHDNETISNDVLQDVKALVDWSISHITGSKSHITDNADVCCIIDKIKYIQSPNMPLILKCLRYRLINQCCQISQEFLIWFLMSLFENEECIENGVYLRLVATIKPENWIFEWIIMEIICHSDVEDEFICRELLSKVHGHKLFLFICRYLSKLKEGEIMTKSMVEIMMGTLQTLNPDIEDRFLIELETISIYEWGYTIKWNKNITALESLSLSWQDDSKLLDAAYYSSQIINRHGKELVDKIYHCVKTYRIGTDMFLSVLKRLYASKLRISIKELDMVKSLEEAKSIFEDSSLHQGTRAKENILSSMKTDSNTTLEECEVEKIGSILDKIENSGSMPSTVLATAPTKEDESNEYKTKTISLFSENDIKAWSIVCKKELNDNPQKFSKLFTEIVTVIDRAIALRRGFGLRNTQKISIIAFNLYLNGLAESYKGILQQMSTGEGKTIVIVVLSILKVLQGEKVDIITSSSVLANRDSEMNKDIFNLFEISVSNNCSEDKHDRQDSYLSFVVYGEIGTFQRDILLTEFYDENIIGGRDRENVIVDEVDSMLLDRGETVLYLSHEIAGIDAIEFVYTFIWTLVHSKEMIGTESDRRAVRRGMLDAMYGVISIEDISKCFMQENSTDVYRIWKILQKEEIIDHEGQLLTRNFAQFTKLENKETSYPCELGHIINLLKDTVRKGILVEVPKFLESFIKRHLDTWILNAFRAKYMEEGKHFIIDIERTENGRGKDVNIVIMDIDTGTEQYHMQWNSGLHQFLQLKYKCSISAESLKAVFMSNISYFRTYNNLHGLTGTLGSQKERDLLKDMFNVRYITIPTFQETRFVEHDTTLCKSAYNWMKSITETALNFSQSRPVLVICETIKSCDELEKEFKRIRVDVHVYKNSYCELSILKKKTDLNSGCIILATNLAGRGTDIRISENISAIGGLHVVLTYLPANLRIEEQAFGRAARKGQYGSGQLIIWECMEGQHKPTEKFAVSRMKIQRDMTENERISKIQQRYDTFILAEENLFRKFQKYYDNFKRLIAKKTDTEFQKILLQALLDRWAFWLDTVETSLSSSKNVQSVTDSLDEFLEDIDDSVVHNDSTKMTILLHSPSHLVKAGKAKVSTGDYDAAQTFFDKVIVHDPSFSECALYYKVHCLLKKGDHTDENNEIVQNTLVNCKHLIQQRLEKYRNAVQTINAISSQYTNKRETLTLSTGFVKQKENAIQIYDQILHSIDSITGYAIEPFMFVDATCSQIDATMIFNDLFTLQILTPPRVRIFPPEKTAWLSVKKSYELYHKEILCRLNELKDKDGVSAEDFQDIIPNREELWKLLIKQGVLKDETNCILLNEAELQRCGDSLPRSIVKILNSFTENSVMKDINEYIFLYLDQKDKIISKESKIIRIEIFKKIGFGKIFEVLQREKIVSPCSFALLATDASNTVSRNRFQKFDLVTCNLFVELGVPLKTSKAIFGQLVTNDIVSNDGQFKLGIKRLSPFSKYTSDVWNIIEKHSKYRICALYLLRELDFPLDLFSHPHKTLFQDLVETKIVTPFKVKANITEEEITKQLKFLYGFDSDKKTNKPSSGTDDLQHVIEQPKILSSEIIDLCRENNFSAEELEEELIDKGICVKENSNLKLILKNDELEKTSFKIKISHFKLELKCFLSSRLQNYLNRSGIELQLNRWKEGLAKFENANPELQSVADSFTEEQLIGLCDEILSIANSGFGELIVLTERKWTLKSISRMICVLAIGMIQIGIAIVIEFISIGAGTFFANVLLSEGIGDIMFAVECMISGHCTLQSYLQHKVLSMSINVTTAGIGALFARGAQYSRFGYKIGGQFLQKKSALELMKSGVSKRLLAKATAKRIGRKLVEASSMKLINTGVDFAIEKALRATLDKFCDAIVDYTIKLSSEVVESLTESLSSLARKYGKHDAKQIVDKSIGSSTLEESNMSLVLTKLNQLATALHNNLGEAMDKLDFCGDSRVKFVSGIVNIVGKFEKGVEVVNAVQQVGSMKLRIINKFEKDIRRRSMFKDGNDKTEIDDCNSWAGNQIDNVIIKVNSEVSKYLEMQLENIIIKPMLQKVGCKVQKQISKGLSELYHYRNKCMHGKVFRKLKADVETELQHTVSDVKVYMKLQYGKKLLNLLKKVRDPCLFADIVEEGVPLGIHSVQAISEITGAIIEIETIGCDSVTMPQRFTPSGTCNKGQVYIALQFYVNPDTGIGHFLSPTNTDDTSKNYDCLLRAVLQETGLKLERHDLAEHIRNDENTQKNIKQGFHEHFIIAGGTGGVKTNKQFDLNATDIIQYHDKIDKLNLKLQNTTDKKIRENILVEIQEIRNFFNNQRDRAQKTHKSEMGTGSDEVFKLSLLATKLAPSCQLGNAQYIKPTTVMFGNKPVEVDYLKAFFYCRFDTRYVVFIREGELHGHSGALYARSGEKTVGKKKPIEKDKKSQKQPNVGALTKGQKHFHDIREEYISKNFENHLFGILAGFQGHLVQLPTETKLREMGKSNKLKNCHSAIGLDLWKTDHLDKFIVGFEREKYKICIAAEHLIESNMKELNAGPEKNRLEQFKKSFNDIQTSIAVDNNYKRQIQNEMKEADNFKTFGDLLRNPATHLPLSN